MYHGKIQSRYRYFTHKKLFYHYRNIAISLSICTGDVKSNAWVLGLLYIYITKTKEITLVSTKHPLWFEYHIF